MSIILDIHVITAVLVLLAGLVSLVWGIVVIVQTRAKSATSLAVDAAKSSAGGSQRIFRILLSITAALGLLQALIGVLLVTVFGQHPTDSLHYVYGLIVLGAIPVAYVYSDQKQVRRDIIIMTIAAVAVFGAAVRGLMTGFGLH